jgi:hypothetical protein
MEPASGPLWSPQTSVQLGMGQSGDSGGAVFAYNVSAATWQLVGIMGAIGTFSDTANPNGQPSGTAVFSNATFAADVAYYNAAILTAIPEPTVTGLGGGAAALGLAGIVRFLRRQKERGV